jgi:hypothetical protein
MATMVIEGQPFGVVPEGFNAASQYADGTNLYHYLRANPIQGRDPSGLVNALTITYEVASVFTKFGPLVEAFEDRTMALDRFVEMAAIGEIDLGMAEWQESQLDIRRRCRLSVETRPAIITSNPASVLWTCIPHRRSCCQVLA